VQRIGLLKSVEGGMKTSLRASKVVQKEETKEEQEEDEQRNDGSLNTEIEHVEEKIVRIGGTYLCRRSS